MTETRNSPSPACYEIRIGGKIVSDWHPWLQDIPLQTADNETLLTFTAVDQPALHGLLKRIRDSGLPLLGIRLIERTGSATEENTSMKAAVFKHYGSADEVRLDERPLPEIGANEVLIRVVTTTVNSGDWRVRSLNVPFGFGLMVRLFFGVFRPRKQVLGTELAGVVSTIGKDVTRFAVGDDVVAMTGAYMGAHAEYVSMSENRPMVRKPGAMSWSEAAALSFGGCTALDFLCRRANMKAGERVLVNGASGTVGSAAVQIAKYHGAHVTAVCSNANADMVLNLGADEVIDYHQSDFTQSGQPWDIIFDAVGNALWTRAKPALAPNGRLLMIVADLPQTLLAGFRRDKQGRKAIAGTAREHNDDLTVIAKLAEEGAFKPVIAKTFRFEDIRDAHAVFDQGSKHGSLVVEVSDPG